jgi:acyl-CoA synthetase (AMP-forming)/AMP-acid ligase II
MTNHTYRVIEIVGTSPDRAVPCWPQDQRAPLVSYGVPYSPILRVVDPDIRVAWPSGCVGEIWARGDNAAIGYWRKPEETEHTFNAELRDPSSGTPERHGCEPGTWGVTTLRTT